MDRMTCLISKQTMNSLPHPIRELLDFVETRERQERLEKEA